MCGIVGLYMKNPALEPELGRLFAPMLIEMSDRGPDSAGIAIYHDPLEDEGAVKLTLFHPDDDFDWEELVGFLGEDLQQSATVHAIASHAVLISDGDADLLTQAILGYNPKLQVMSTGRVIEIYKETGLPAAVARRFALEAMGGSHVIGHTRMATESAVTTAGSHPFSTGLDLCLVHNGSLSNHNWLRSTLERRYGLVCRTENDTEVAAAYLTAKLLEGRTLHQALEDSIDDLDGFYTFCVGTADGFAVLRDPIACKPAILAETKDWVAMASEYRALTGLPGVGDARVWEPEPATVYSWGWEAA
ncbi:MAG: class II glutamine amidotransferase [Alphaproteobacteria bacterium]|nr:class II glutamine amidotransferase [Alphaproteobacteria bacterium]